MNPAAQTAAKDLHAFNVGIHVVMMHIVRQPTAQQQQLMLVVHDCCECCMQMLPRGSHAKTCTFSPQVPNVDTQRSSNTIHLHKALTHTEGHVTTAVT